MTSPFQLIDPSDWIADNDLAFAIWDLYPVTEGHTLVITKRIVATWWDADADERRAVMDLVDEVRDILVARFAVDAFNVGFNAGVAAGQTVAHLHMHVIPRRVDDCEDPAGGVRSVFPERANYLKRRLVPAGHDQLLAELLRCIQSPAYDRIDLLVSFVMASGLTLIANALEDALGRGAKVRLLTTDYLNITQPEALGWLLDRHDSDGALQTRVFRGSHTSFHPKAYLFASERVSGRGEAFVGSSNLSRSGLATGVEWNLSTNRVAELRAEFETLWGDERCQLLDRQFLSEYRARHLTEQPRPGAEQVAEPAPEDVRPFEHQSEALAALALTREEGFQSGLVVMATGLGKTWLAAFDSGLGFERVLFLAHREEILRQSRDVFRRVRPRADLGMLIGRESRGDAEVVFASVQTMVRRLDRFAPDAFDYIVVDEFHHAAAPTYRRIIDHFAPRFLLGLTATPERMDGADLLSLCGENVVYRCDLVEGIQRGMLSPFAYFGIRDTTDFAPIPWRNGRFDPELLTQAVETQERAAQALAEWRSRGGKRTLAFCCSRRHSDFMAAYFVDHGVRAVSVHAGAESAPRHESISRLRSGDIEVVFCVDLFNEGLDVPEIDTVLMLRPTESPVIFLQQLGRGLRRSAESDRLTVVDFIGNHRSFLVKPRTLLSLGMGSTPSIAKMLDAMRDSAFELPEGCSVAYDIGLVDMFRELTRMGRISALEEFCDAFLDGEGVRPSAAQAFRAGFDLKVSRTKEGSWFELLDRKQLLGDDESRVLERHREFFRAIEVEPTTKSFKLVTLRALLHDGALISGAGASDIASTALQLIRRDPRLIADVRSDEVGDVRTVAEDVWAKYWRKWPIAAWVGELKGTPSEWFHMDGAALRLKFTVAEEDEPAFVGMVAELTEYLLSRYFTRRADGATGIYRCKLSHSGGNPIVRFDRRQCPLLPDGSGIPFLANGERFAGDFRRIALNVARSAGESGNALHGLLRGWFGPSAGLPGTRHHIRLEKVGVDWVMTPESVESEESASLIPLYPSYRVACGAFSEVDSQEHAKLFRRVIGQANSPAELFVARAEGNSMEGGSTPVRNGDYLLCRWVRNVARADLVGTVVLVEMNGQSVLKRLERETSGSYVLASSDEKTPAIQGTSDMKIVAQLDRVLTQRDINPIADRLHQDFIRKEIPELYGEVFNVGNWNTGHVSLDGRAILFTTLDKSGGMSEGSHYVDGLESSDILAWSSQSSTAPTGRKGREIVESIENDTDIEIWLRKRKRDPFTYAGLAVLQSYEGEKPMRVRWRLFDPLPPELWRKLGPA